MKKIVPLLFSCSIFCICCSSFKIVPKQSSTYTIVNDDCAITPYDSKYFLSGYYSNHDYFFVNNSFNICLTDSICFYKIQKVDKYFHVPSYINFFDLSKDYSFFNDSENIYEAPAEFDPKLISKINNFKRNNLYNGQYYPFYIIKKNINYHYSDFKNNSQINLSYHIVFGENRNSPYTRTGIPALDVASDLIEVATKLTEEPLLFSDFIFIEAFPKNFIITKVEDSRYYSINPTWHNGMRWDFIEKENMNCLIIYFNDIKSKPKNIKPNLNIKISGLYKK